MANPQLVSLVRAMFPADAWASALVNSFNQFALEVVTAFQTSGVKYKTLDFTTGATVADSFPIAIPVAALPLEVRLASVLSGVPSGAVTVQWAPILTPTPCINLTSLTGLAPSTRYSVRLAYQ